MALANSMESGFSSVNIFDMTILMVWRDRTLIPLADPCSFRSAGDVPPTVTPTVSNIDMPQVPGPLRWPDVARTWSTYLF